MFTCTRTSRVGSDSEYSFFSRLGPHILSKNSVEAQPTRITPPTHPPTPPHTQLHSDALHSLANASGGRALESKPTRTYVLVDRKTDS